MERRRERRGILDQSVQITLLKTPPEKPGAQRLAPSTFTAQTIDQSGRGMRLLMPFDLLAGTTLKIETGSTLLLAEVCYCARVNDERFAAGVEISQSLQFTKELRQLHDAVAASAGSRQPVSR